MSAWRYHIEGDIRHIWPDEDILEHVFDDETVCPCGPKYEQTEWYGILVIHQSFLDSINE